VDVILRAISGWDGMIVFSTQGNKGLEVEGVSQAKLSCTVSRKDVALNFLYALRVRTIYRMTIKNFQNIKKGFEKIITYPVNPSAMNSLIVPNEVFYKLRGRHTNSKPQGHHKL